MKSTLRYGICVLVVINGLLFAGITFSGCKKTKTTLDNTRLATDYITSQLEVNALVDMMSAVGGIGTDKPNDITFLPTCSTVVFDTLKTPKTIRVNFGTSNCLSGAYDNQYRRGTVIMKWTGRLRDVSNHFQISVLNYSLNNNTYSVGITVTNLGQGSNASYSLAYTANDTLTYITDNSQAIATYSMTKQFSGGYYTVSPLDNEYSLTGTSSGVGSQGIAYTTTIQSPIEVENTCQYRLLGGNTEVAPNATGAFLLDFGSGKCDNTATLNVNGLIKTIEFYL